MKIAVSILATQATGTFKIWKFFLFSGLGTELPETPKLLNYRYFLGTSPAEISISFMEHSIIWRSARDSLHRAEVAVKRTASSLWEPELQSLSLAQFSLQSYL